MKYEHNGRFAVDREFDYIARSPLEAFPPCSKASVANSKICKTALKIQSSSLDVSENGAKLAILGLIWPILAPWYAPRSLHLELQGRSELHLGPSWRQEGADELSPKNGDHFPRKLWKNIIFHSSYEPPVILQRIHRIQRIQRKWGVGLQVRTSLPHAPGTRMTVVTQTPSN